MTKFNPIENPKRSLGLASAVLLMLLSGQLNCASERPAVKPETPREAVAEEAGEADIDLSEYIRDDFTIRPSTSR